MTSPNDGREPQGTPSHHEQADLHTYDAERHLPEQHNPLPALDHADTPRSIDEEAFMAVQNSDEFVELKRRFRGFAFPMTAAFLLWYFGYVLASVFAKDAMATPVIGHLNIGLLLGLFQFVTTFAITALYLRHMRRSIDPIATKLRDDLEGTAR